MPGCCPLVVVTGLSGGGKSTLGRRGGGLARCRRVPPEALLVIDELGPLELLQHEGWTPLVPLLRAHIGPVMVVVRPSLIAPFLVLADGRNPDTVEVTPAVRD